MKKICCLVAAMAVIWFGQAQKVNLGLNLTKGETYKITISSSGTYDLPKDGKQSKAYAGTFAKMEFKVADIQGDKYLMDATLDSLAYKGNAFSAAMGNYSKNAKMIDDSSNLFLQRLVSYLKGMHFRMNITKSGKTELADIIINDSSKIKQVGSLFIMGLMKSIPVYFPEYPVAKGDKWKVNRSEKSRVVKSEGINYELKEIGDTYFFIKGSTATQKNIKNPLPKYGQPAGALDMTESSTLNIKIDRKTGWIVDATIHSSVKTNIKADPKKPGDKGAHGGGETEIVITGK